MAALGNRQEFGFNFDPSTASFIPLIILLALQRYFTSSIAATGGQE
jgi:hypothetical protein